MTSPHTAPIPLPLPDQNPLRAFLGLLRPHRGKLTLAALAFIVKDSPLWLMPVITANVIDIVVDRRSLGELAISALLAVLLLVQNYPNHMAFTKLFSGVTRRLAADLRNTLTAHLQGLSIGYHKRASAAVIQTKVVRDVENVELMMQQAFPAALSSVAALIGAIVMTAISVPQFVAVFALTVPIAVLLMRYVRARSRHRNEAFRRQVEQFSAGIGEMASLIPITRAHGLEKVAVDRVSDRTEEVRSAGINLDVLNGRFGAMSWVAYQLLGVFCLVAAAAAALTGVLPITPGQVVLLSTYFTILTGGIVALLSLIPVFTRGLESIRSISEVLQDPDLEENDGKAVPETVAGDLEFEDVSFIFPGDDRAAIGHLNLHIRAGETIAFVGASGSGKSTLLNLVLGFLRPSGGRILLDGVDMEALDLRAVRTFVSVVPQDSVLFDGTVRDNITYGLEDVSDERVLRALTDAHALDIVEHLPLGWDTPVGERGATLSGGQRQRLAIARALVRDPRILFLDEATSALDSESESHIKQALEGLMRERTTLIVAHRLSTIRSADRIVVLRRGVIVEQGTHAELLAAEGHYARLHHAQNG
ncbi:ABC transporter ATP-binding protein [Mycetocola spongiae]|uniref:ABC transporter ATP-binding protein n=1 Tax=Mycetocola spongiae TaxID=2859226 RepID=UPI001CF115F7|nr:ABC transporter ATP-binding protein [Mycetocola spongiae]UCR88394.1 ABC transporter ATP-binding protein/permease [Mycetocola spongiae]